MENQQMVGHLVHEVAVVADHDDAAAEILQIFFKRLERGNVEVIGGFVQHEEIGIGHQHHAELETAALATR